MKHLVLWSLIGGLGNRLAQFVAVTTLAWLVDPNGFGQFSALLLTVQSLSGVFVTAAGLGANVQSDGLGGTLQGRLANLRAVRFSCGAAAAGLLVAPLMWFLLYRTTPGPLVYAAGLLSGLSVLAETAVASCAALGRMRLVAVAECSRGIAGGIGVLGMGLVIEPAAAILGIFVGDAVVAAFLLAVTEAPPNATPHPVGLWRSGVFRFGVVANLVTQLGMMGMPYFLTHQFGARAVAAYVLANRFAALALTLPGFLTRNSLAMLGTHVVRGEADRFWSSLRRYIAVVSALALGSGVLALIVSQTAFSHLLNKYPGTREMLIVLVVAAVASAVGSALGVACVALNSLRTWLTADVAMSVTILGGALLACSANAQPAVVVAALVPAYLVGAIVRLVSIRRTFMRGVLA